MKAPSAIFTREQYEVLIEMIYQKKQPAITNVKKALGEWEAAVAENCGNHAARLIGLHNKTKETGFEDFKTIQRETLVSLGWTFAGPPLVRLAKDVESILASAKRKAQRADEPMPAVKTAKATKASKAVAKTKTTQPVRATKAAKKTKYRT